MKKLLVCLVVLAFLLVPAMAMAYNDGQDLPSGATEQTHWEWNPDKDGVGVGGWDEYKAGNTAALARCWTSGGSWLLQQGKMEYRFHAPRINGAVVQLDDERYSLGLAYIETRYLCSRLHFGLVAEQ